MSGHSKWATTKRAKAVTDAKRSSLFTKIARIITVAAREKGGDPATNFSLRLAIDKARAANMPRENIERSIKRGTGEIEGAAIEELYYEGIGPGGSAIIIKALTDNKNRTASDIKHILSQHNSSLAGPGAVMWQFEKKGVIRIDQEQIKNKNFEELELQLIDWGVQDILKEEEGLTLFTKIEDLQNVKKNIEEAGLELTTAGVEYIPKEKANLSPEILEKNLSLFEDLEDSEDVDEYFSNL